MFWVLKEMIMPQAWMLVCAMHKLEAMFDGIIISEIELLTLLQESCDLLWQIIHLTEIIH